MSSLVPPSRPVRIRSQDVAANPQPRSAPLTDDFAAWDLEDQAFFDVISEKNLKSLSQQDDLSLVTSIELEEIDTREDSLSKLGQRLPSLVELRLTNSVIVSLRDLGSSLNALTILSLPRCGLGELDGVAALPLLRELYASFNFITSCRPLALADRLAVLDLEGNNISDPAEADSLSLCRSLETLSLEGNPLLEDPAAKDALIATLQQALPSLRLDVASAAADTEAMVAAPEQAVIRQALQRGDHIDDARPTTAWSRPGTARPGTARPGTGRPGSSRPMTSRPGTSRRPGTAFARPGTARIGSDSFDDGLEDASSDLTQGDTVFCGNPLKALMARRQPTADSAASELSQEDLDALLRSVGLDDTRAADDAPVDLEAWRAQYRRTTALLEGSSSSPLVSSRSSPATAPQQKAPLGATALARPSPPPDMAPSPPVDESETGEQKRRTLPRPPTAGRTLPQPPASARPRTGSGIRRLPTEPARPSSGPASGPAAVATGAP